MARSTYIYIVQANIQSDIWAAFTVKHEMESWLERIEDDCDEYHVIRIKDNPQDEHFPETIIVGPPCKSVERRSTPSKKNQRKSSTS